MERNRGRRPMTNEAPGSWRKKLYRVADLYGMTGQPHKTLRDAADALEASEQVRAEVEAMRRGLQIIIDNPPGSAHRIARQVMRGKGEA